MKRTNRMLAVLMLAALGLCTACVDVVVSLTPWFPVEEGDSEAFIDSRLPGMWCEDDGECPESEAMHWKPGPGKSFNVFGDGELRYRVWLAEIEGISYLNWWFLCEPSTGADDDDCMKLDFPLGTHIVARIDRLDAKAMEIRILEGEKFEQVLATEAEPLPHARQSDFVVVLEDPDELQAFLARHGHDNELWSEEPMVLVRRGD